MVVVVVVEVVIVELLVFGYFAFMSLWQKCKLCLLLCVLFH